MKGSIYQSMTCMFIMVGVVVDKDVIVVVVVVVVVSQTQTSRKGRTEHHSA